MEKGSVAMPIEAKELTARLTEWEVKLILKSLQERASKLDVARSKWREDADAAALAENDLIELNSFRSRFVEEAVATFGKGVLNLSEELL